MKSHLISINDIAKALNISPSTVSRALKDHPDISVETKKVVQKYAADVNYRPNALALSLKKQRSNTLGLIIPEIVHHFFSSIISGIEELAYSKGYRLIICQSNEDYEREIINTHLLLDNRVDGVLVSQSKNTHNYNHFTELIESGIPIVFFDRICTSIETDRVVTNDFEGAYLATKHLISRGARKILHLASPEHLQIGQLRMDGYTKALSDYGLNNRLTLECDTREDVFRMKEMLLAYADKIDGIFAVNDFTAIAAMQVLQQNGYQIPGDIKVVGFGNDPIASIACPALTTVEQDGYAIGNRAVEILLNRIEDPLALSKYSHIIIPVKLTLRQSS